MDVLNTRILGKFYNKNLYLTLNNLKKLWLQQMQGS